MSSDTRLTNVTKVPQWTFKKTYLVEFLDHTDATYKNVVKVTQVFFVLYLMTSNDVSWCPTIIMSRDL